MVKKLRKILVPLDGSKNSIRGLETAIKIAAPHGAKITGINVISKSFSYGIKYPSEIKRKTKEKADHILENAARRSKKNGIPFTKKLEVGSNIGKSIVKFADNNKFDLVVIGSRGPDPGFEIFFGSVANFVLHKSKIPVTVVK